MKKILASLAFVSMSVFGMNPSYPNESSSNSKNVSFTQVSNQKAEASCSQNGSSSATQSASSAVTQSLSFFEEKMKHLAILDQRILQTLDFQKKLNHHKIPNCVFYSQQLQVQISGLIAYRKAWLNQNLLFPDITEIQTLCEDFYLLQGGLFPNLTKLYTNADILIRLPLDNLHFPKLTDLEIMGNIDPTETIEKIAKRTIAIGRPNKELAERIRYFGTMNKKISDNPLEPTDIKDFDYIIRKELLLEKINKLISKVSPTLQKLKLMQNGLQVLPDAVSSCKNLTEMYLEGNEEIFSLNPNEQLSKLPLRLQSLDIINCGLLNVPDITRFKQLIKLDLSDNNLSTLPPQIGDLKNLQTLHLTLNNLSTLPPQIGDLENLRTLRLDDNEIRNLPERISNCKNLEKLELSDNHISIETTIKTIKNLSQLKYLSFSFSIDSLTDEVDVIPPEIGYLKNLEHLDFSGRDDIKSIPPEIGKLGNLQYLNLASTKISTLPSEIGNLVNLTALHMEDNSELKLIPEEYWNLLNLREVSFDPHEEARDYFDEEREFDSDEEREEVHSDTNGEIIDRNLYETERFLTPNFTVLNARGLNLAQLPIDIFMYNHIEKLDISDNKFQYIPPVLQRLTSLKSINISQNKIKSIPSFFWSFPNLGELTIDGLLIKYVPVDRILSIRDIHNLGEGTNVEGIKNAVIAKKRGFKLGNINMLQLLGGVCTLKIKKLER